MIQEALEYLMMMAAKRIEPIDLGIKDPTSKIVAIGGKVEVIPLPVKPREHHVSSLADFIGLVATYGGTSSVFFDESAINVILDDDSHRVAVSSFALTKSDQWRTLESLKGWLDHKAFVRLLRIDLRGCHDPASLLDIVRNIKLEGGTQVVAKIERQKESLGRSITGAVLTEKEMPEEIDISVPIYKSAGETEVYTVVCSVEVDPMRSDSFRLAPMPDELERAQQCHMESIRARLVAALPNTPIFYGHP